MCLYIVSYAPFFHQLFKFPIKMLKNCPFQRHGLETLFYSATLCWQKESNVNFKKGFWGNIYKKVARFWGEKKLEVKLWVPIGHQNYAWFPKFSHVLSDL
jgi:hypothetical protein